MISMEGYWKGRDKQYAGELNQEIRDNASVVVGRVNDLLERANLKSFSVVASGWRPGAINDATANAAKSSKHLTGQACDIADHDRILASWCADNLDVLEDVGLWCEDFRWTPTWVHFQCVAPKSGKRVFIPSSAPAIDPTFPVTWA